MWGVTARVLWFASRRTGATAWAAAAVGVAAGLVRLPRALSDPFWQDEVASARILREPTVGRMLSHVARTESTPPLWYTIGWLAHLGGVSIHDVRLLSVAFGAILAGMGVVLARGVVTLPYALFAGVLVSCGGQFVAHGREIRAYELFALLTVVFAFAIEAEVRTPSTRHALVLAVSTAAGLLTHYFFVFTVAAGLVWLWIEPQAVRMRRQATLAVAAGFVVCLAWAPVLLRQYHQHRFKWIGAFDARTALNTMLRLFSPLPRPGVAATLVGLVVLATAGVGAVRLSATSPRGRLCAVLALVPLVLAWSAWLIGFRIYSVRNMIGIGAFVAIALAAAVAALPGPARTAVAAIATALMLGIFAWDQRVPAPPYDGMARALVAEGWKPHDGIAVFGDLSSFRSPLEWYLPRFPVLVRVSPGQASRGLYAIADLRTARHLLGYSTARTTVGSFVVMRLTERVLPLLGGVNILAAPPARRFSS